MATQTWTSAIAHSSDADFRTWGSELSAKLAAAGLVKHTDTGQIDWATAARPAISAVAGYEVWRFDDALQATAPIFLKIEYGTGTNAAYPQIWLTVGPGTNGGGTLTGATTDRASTTINGALGVGNFPSYLCVGEGFVGLLWKAGAYAGNGYGFFAVSRTNDTAGAGTGDGFFVLRGGTAALTVCPGQSVRTAAPAAAYTASTLYSVVPGQVVGSAVGTDFQVYPIMGIWPRAYVLPTLAAVIASEAPSGNTFQVAMVGGSARTLLSVGRGYCSVVVGAGPGVTATYGIAMLWE